LKRLAIAVRRCSRTEGPGGKPNSPQVSIGGGGGFEREGAPIGGLPTSGKVRLKKRTKIREKSLAKAGNPREKLKGKAFEEKGIRKTDIRGWTDSRVELGGMQDCPIGHDARYVRRRGEKESDGCGGLDAGVKELIFSM